MSYTCYISMVLHVPCGELLDAEDKHSINLPFLKSFFLFSFFFFSLSPMHRTDQNENLKFRILFQNVPC